MPLTTVYLGLGSNVGDTWQNLRNGVAGLQAHGVTVEAVSPAYLTEPVGEVLDQADFLNAALRATTILRPEPLLDACKAVEVQLGRDMTAPRHAPRPLDVDLLLFGDSAFSSERLTLPHPDLINRRFVMIPLLDLDPDLTMPDGTVIADRVKEVDDERVELAGELSLDA